MRRLAAVAVLLTSVMALGGAEAQANGVISVLKCKPGPVHQVDPIIFPGGEKSGHVHQFFAGRGIRPVGEPTTRSGMLAGGSTCPLSADTAGYWVPVVLDAKGVAVPPIQINAYYRGGAVSAFPPDFQAVCGVGGAGSRRSPSDPFTPCLDTQSQNTVGWGCTDSESEPTISAALPCPDKVIAHIQFGFPKAWGLPKITLHARYPASRMPGARLSSDHEGEPGGSSLHADFWNTWNQDVLDFLVNRCLRGNLSCKGLTDAKVRAMPGAPPF